MMPKIRSDRDQDSENANETIAGEKEGLKIREKKIGSVDGFTQLLIARWQMG